MTDSIDLPDDAPVLGETPPHHADAVTLSNNPRAFASFSSTRAKHFVAIYVTTRFFKCLFPSHPSLLF